MTSGKPAGAQMAPDRHVVLTNAPAGAAAAIRTATRRPDGKPRVHGLIRLMQEVRRAQAEGVTPTEADLLRERISAALRASQEACLHRRISPLDLPMPSRQAFAFLSALDAEQLPIRSGPGAHGAELRIGRLVAWRDRVQSDLTSLARTSLKTPGQLEWLELTLSDVHATCVGLARRVEARLAATGMQADRLPDPSRRAFRWFQWLADRSNLKSHYRAAVFCMGVDPRVVVRFYNQAALYKATLRGEQIDLTLHEAFARAPEEVLLGLVKVVLPHTRKRRWREAIRLHVEGEAFRDGLQMMEGSQESVLEAVQGRAHDLRALYERVNAAYLGGKVARPRLAWTDRPTGREFGSYQPLTDSITISLSLDSPDVPGYVVEHVMHHELLHKLLGTPTQNGRRRVHTPAFRRLERVFPRFEEADAFLRKLSRQLLHS